MKNFKKVLALVLVLASLLGLATMAGAATEYKDADKINADYTEAIKVLDLIETMQGYPDGNFKPTATITREEAAKVIAIFDNKDADISTYYTSINPFTDEKGRWGESYVGYGYRAGIIAGMNATTYAPTSNVTGTQFLKMALVTLGYDQEAEGFVGSSWAVNVLALAKRIKLIDGLKDGWKPEKDLTREEAAQILLNTLNSDTIEYAQEAKSANWKPTEKDGVVTWGGKLYLTVAGAVKTGNKLYKDFDLKKEVSTDAFYRPYIKWTKDKVSVEIMKAPKATFTKKFSACDLLVALGIPENDRKTKIVIDEVYCDGDDTVDLADHAIYAEADDYTYEVDGEDVEAKAWHHEYSTCAQAKGAKHGAQGTLTQVFYNGKDADGNKHYTITSIETWLGKVDKVSTKTTSRDNHLKNDGNVTLSAYLHDLQKLEENNYNYCGETYEDTDNSSKDGHTAHCEEIIRKAGNDPKADGTYTLMYSGETDGLKKDDYVLFTYSFRTKDGKNDYEDAGVQTLDLTEGKNGRLSGYKFGTSAGSDPSETRIDSEYVKDSQHFHMGYDASKTKDYGTYTFFYDAYGNVIGMKDAADSSKWAVIDRAWVTFENKGTAIMNADVVSVDDAKTTTSTVKKFTDVDDYIDEVDDAINDSSAKNFAYDLAVYLKDLTNGEGYKDFAKIYDHLFKVSTDKDGVFSLKVAKDSAGANVVNGYGNLEDTDDTIKVSNKKPYLEINDGSHDDFTEITLTSSTKFLVHKMDGTYVAYTGYKNVPSMIAHYAEVVFDSDYADKFVAEVVYLTNDVYMTDGKMTAYVGKGADRSNIEVKEDGDPYYNLTIWVKGVETNVYVSEDDMEAYFDAKENNFEPGFFELQYTDIDDITVVKVLKESADLDDYLDEPVAVDYFNGTVIKLENETYALADDCGLFGIYKNKVETIEASEIESLYEDVTGDTHKVFVEFNKDDEVVAVYMLLASND